MVRSTAFTSLFALALAAGSAHAEAGNVVGGSGATLSGGGDNMVITYATGGATGCHRRPKRSARKPAAYPMQRAGAPPCNKVRCDGRKREMEKSECTKDAIS